jgi:hypothetical protein
MLGATCMNTTTAYEVHLYPVRGMNVGPLLFYGRVDTDASLSADPSPKESYQTPNGFIVSEAGSETGRTDDRNRYNWRYQR